MTRLRSVGALAAACLLSACSTQPLGDGRLRELRVGYSGEADFGDLPSFVAHASLRDRGVAVEVTHFSAPDLAVEAAARGVVDIVHGTMVGAWAAAARGARIRTVADHVANPYRLVIRSDVTGCAGLNGRRLALASESAVSAVLVRAFLAESCPGVRPERLLIPESANRAAALEAGGVDAAVLDLNTLLWLDGRMPGRFRVLCDFAERWPGIKTTGVHVNADFADAHLWLVEEYVRALREAGRALLADQGLLASVATERFGAAQDWAAAAAAFRGASAWAADGSLGRTDVMSTLEFFKAHAGLPPHTSVEMVVHPRFLDQWTRADRR
jgi:ABC-type nitrate/sulfonate/bicarbonate transport system substrate-binding protein